MLKLKLQYFGHLIANSQLIGKDPDARKYWRQKEKRATEDERVGWHHWLNGHEPGQTPGHGEGQGSLASCSPWGCRVWHDLATRQGQNYVLSSGLNVYILSHSSHENEGVGTLLTPISWRKEWGSEGLSHLLSVTQLPKKAGCKPWESCQTPPLGYMCSWIRAQAKRPMYPDGGNYTALKKESRTLGSILKSGECLGYTVRWGKW